LLCSRIDPNEQLFDLSNSSAIGIAYFVYRRATPRALRYNRDFGAGPSRVHCGLCRLGMLDVLLCLTYGCSGHYTTGRSLDSQRP